MRERATRGRGKTQLVDVAWRFLETSPRPPSADALLLTFLSAGDSVFFRATGCAARLSRP